MKLLTTFKRVLVLLTLFATAPALAAEIQLLETISIPMGRYGQKWLSVYTKLKVQNLAYDKEIELKFTDKEGHTTTAKASYLGASSDAYEIWESYTTLKIDGTRSPFAAEDYRLNISYHSAAGDFRLPEGEITLQTGPILHSGEKVQIAMPSTRHGQGGLPLSVVLANLAYTKSVNVHYSCDNFATESTQSFQFQPYYTYGYGLVTSPTPAGFEIWTTWISAVCQDLSYYVSYEIFGQKYMDGSAQFPYHSQRSY